jgi:magnesium-protoporphyrin O-methyltransferase
MTYESTRNTVETYFDRTATKTWERLTSDAPVSGIRATVRAGRDRMRQLLLSQLPADLRGARVLDAGCGTGGIGLSIGSGWRRCCRGGYLAEAHHNCQSSANPPKSVVRSS